MTNRLIGLGLLGASRIAAKILPSIIASKRFHIEGVAALNNDRSSSFARENNIQNYYSNYVDLLSEKRIEAVYISTLNASHFEHVKISLLSGKHVLCEKPLVLSSQEAEELFALARERRLILLEGLMHRHHGQIKFILDNLPWLGSIKQIDLDFSFELYDTSDLRTRKRATVSGGGGALNDLGCYAIDFVNQILNYQIPSTSHYYSKRLNSGFEIAAFVKLKFKNVDVNLTVAVDRPGFNLWQIKGENGSISAPRFDPVSIKENQVFFLDRESKLTTVQCEAVDVFKLQFRNFADAIEGAFPQVVREEHSIANVRLAEVIKRSEVVNM